MKSAKAKQTWPMGHKVNSMKSSGGRERREVGGQPQVEQARTHVLDKSTK